MIGRFMFGYRHGEVPLPMSKLDPSKIKKTIKFGASKVGHMDHVPRVPVSRTLPIYFSGSANPRPCPNFPPNVVIAILARVGMDPPPPCKRIIACLRKFVLSFCEQFLIPLETAEVSFDDWLDQCPYTEKRKMELREVWRNSPFDKPVMVPHSTDVKSFIKDESYQEYKAPRTINSRADWFKCYSGPLFGAIGKKVFYTIPEFIKTVPVRSQPEFIIERLYDAFSRVANNDATSYEAHFVPIIMDNIEFVMYFYMCRLSPVFTAKMEEIQATLTGDQLLIFKFFRVVTSAMRMSGEMNTSLGNGFTTLMLVLFLGWINECIVKLQAEGDDNLSIWQFAECVPTEDDWKNLGWVMKVETPESVCVASFCGNVFDIDDKIVIVDPRTALLDFGWVRKTYVNASDVLLLQLLRSKALSMAHQYNGCPMLGTFGRHVVNITSHIKIRKSVVDTMNLYDKAEYLAVVEEDLPAHIEPSMANRILVQRLYSISVEEQLAFEASVPLIGLWSCVEPNFLTTLTSVENYERYTTVTTDEWVFPGSPNLHLVEDVIRSFGPITSEFVETYYI